MELASVHGLEPVTVYDLCHLDREMFSMSMQKEYFLPDGHYIYRGVHKRSCCDLESTLTRLNVPAGSKRWNHLRDVEAGSIREFVRRGQYLLPIQNPSAMAAMSLARHYGAPSRILDWTYNMFVAQHFASGPREHEDQDAYIWCLDYWKLFELMPKEFKESAGPFLVLPLWAAERVASSVATKHSEFELPDSAQGAAFPIVYQAPNYDARMAAQASVFVAMSSPEVTLGQWIERNLYQLDGAVKLLKVSPMVKFHMAERLRLSHFDDFMLFPGLDGLGKAITTNHSSYHYRTGRESQS